MNRVETYHKGTVVLIALKTVVTAVAITAAALAVLALFVTFGSMSDAAVNGCITAATVLSVLLAGFFSARKKAGAGWLSGLVAGLIYVVLMLVIGFFVLDGMQIGADTFKMFLIAVLSGMTGGVLGVNIKAKRK